MTDDNEEHDENPNLIPFDQLEGQTWMTPPLLPQKAKTDPLFQSKAGELHLKGPDGALIFIGNVSFFDLTTNLHAVIAGKVEAARADRAVMDAFIDAFIQHSRDNPITLPPASSLAPSLDCAFGVTAPTLENHRGVPVPVSPSYWLT